MKCPYCGHSEDRVLDTREQKEGETIRRRRECLNCRSRFSTVETLSLAFPFVVKKDGRREPYSKEKVLKGLQAACQKRPISLAQLEAVVERISNWTMARGEKEIPASMVGQKIMRELRALDDVAYVRFASVYRNFQDVQEFVETLEENDGTEAFESTAQLSLTPDIRPAEGKKSEPARSQTEETIPRTRPADSLPN